MSMTRKHYVELADIVGQIDDQKTRVRTTDRLVAMAVRDNPRFDAKRFRRAVEDRAEQPRPLGVGEPHTFERLSTATDECALCGNSRSWHPRSAR